VTPAPGGNRTPVILNDSRTQLYSTPENQSVADVTEITSKNVKGILKWRAWTIIKRISGLRTDCGNTKCRSNHGTCSF
jgi:hypothetical protein